MFYFSANRRTWKVLNCILLVYEQDLWFSPHLATESSAVNSCLKFCGYIVCKYLLSIYLILLFFLSIMLFLRRFSQWYIMYVYLLWRRYFVLVLSEYFSLFSSLDVFFSSSKLHSTRTVHHIQANLWFFCLTNIKFSWVEHWYHGELLSLNMSLLLLLLLTITKTACSHSSPLIPSFAIITTHSGKHHERKANVIVRPYPDLPNSSGAMTTLCLHILQLTSLGLIEQHETQKLIKELD